MPLVTPEAASQFFAARHVPASNAPSIPLATGPIDSRVLTALPVLGHAMPANPVSPLGTPRAKIATSTSAASTGMSQTSPATFSAAAALSLTVLQKRSVHYVMEHAEAKALAEGAIDDAILSLLDVRLEKRRRVDGIPYQFEIYDAKVTVAIQDEAGKIDLNFADGHLLANLFRSVGVASSNAEDLADRVRGWRDVGGGAKANNANMSGYQFAGIEIAPHRGAFQRVDELKFVRGITPEIYRRVASALTVYSHRQWVNLLTAPPEVLQASAMAKGESMDKYIWERAGVYDSTGPFVAGTIDPHISSAGWSFTIRASVSRNEKAPYEFAAVVCLTDNPLHPYWIQDWREVTGESW